MRSRVQGFLFTFPALFLLPVLLGVSCATQRISSDSIAGRVGKRGIGGATVFICDAKTGIPLHPETHRPLTETNSDLPFWSVRSDATGRFSFTNLPPGTYRVMAQAWPGLEETAKNRSFTLNIPPAEAVQLYGTAENIVLPSRSARHVTILPPGKGQITFDQNFPNDGGYVFVSTAPLAGDPILGFLGWSDDFISHIVGIGCIPKGRTMTMTGIPERNINAVIFVNDNSPGFGTAFYATPPKTPQRVPIVAGWSDGHHEPPAKIRHIIEVLDAYKMSAGEVLKLRKQRTQKGYFNYLHDLRTALGPLNRIILLPNGEEATVGDVYGSIGYKNFLENDTKRKR